MDLPRHATANECLAELRKVFFPNGQSPAGNEDDLEFTMADFKCNTIYMCDDFSPESYKQKHSLHTLRLFLLSRDKADSSEESEEEELRESPFRSSVVIVEDNSTQETVTKGTTSQDRQANSAQEKTQPTAARLVHDTVEVNRATDGLIGTSEERRNLMDQVQTEYEASLAADQEKDLEKEANVRREALRMSRKNRVLYEPATHEPRVTVSVRHSILGVVRRAFPPNGTVMALYDWVGSLSTHPEHLLCASVAHTALFTLKMI